MLCRMLVTILLRFVFSHLPRIALLTPKPQDGTSPILILINSTTNLNTLIGLRVQIPIVVLTTFYNKLNKLTNKHAPFKKLSKRKCRQFAKPWITKGLLTSIRKKNKLYLTGQQDEYKCYRNKLTTLIRLSKRNYYHHYFETNVNNMKQTWKG